MSKKIVRYQEWMDAMVVFSSDGDSDEKSGDVEVERAVRGALEKLSDFEKDLIERRFLMCQSSQRICGELGISERDLERGLREAQLRLRRLLAPFVQRRFKVGIADERRCLICDCVERERAEEIIGSKNQEETWRRVMCELDEHLGLKISSPQMLIGHVKYHVVVGEE